MQLGVEMKNSYRIRFGKILEMVTRET